MAPPPFTRINGNVSFQDPAGDGPSSRERSVPSDPNTSVNGQGPETILFFSWGDANIRHIEKYTSLYNEIFPGARIILVRSGMPEFFYLLESTQRKLAEPAVKMLQDTTDDNLLVHVMSNSGSKEWCTVNQVLYKATGRTLSNATTIIDCAPGCSRFSQTWAALAGSLPRSFIPRMIVGFIGGAILFSMHIAKHLLPGPDLLERVRTQLNDLTGVEKGARRCYIYSEDDPIIGWQDVEEHAKEAEEKGWEVVRVKFQGSTHVGNFKKDPDLYRETILQMWFGPSKHGKPSL